jgi:hypothetical protein
VNQVSWPLDVDRAAFLQVLVNLGQLAGIEGNAVPSGFFFNHVAVLLYLLLVAMVYINWVARMGGGGSRSRPRVADDEDDFFIIDAKDCL